MTGVTSPAESSESTVLVTGATGFLGGHCVAALVGKCKVIAVGRNLDLLEKLRVHQSVMTKKLELISQACVDELAELNPSYIVHCAGLSSVWGNYTDFYNANVEITKNILEVAQICNSKLVHISTPSLYMRNQDQLDLSESAELPSEAFGNYAKSKRIAEELVTSWSKGEGLSAAILRPQGIVGLGDTSIVPRFLKVLEKGRFPLLNDGKSLFDLTHVHNVVLAVELALEKLNQHKWDGAEIFNISNGEPESMKETLDSFIRIWKLNQDKDINIKFVTPPALALNGLAYVLESGAKLFGRPEPAVTRHGLNLLTYSRTLDISKARAVLGYDPSGHSIQDAFKSYFEGPT